jgi:predicted nucleic acid-binding protein
VTLYLDSSAIVKLYVDEPGSPATRDLVASQTSVASIVLAGVEVSAAFARARRMGVIDDVLRDALISSFRADWRSYAQIDPIEDILVDAASVAVTQGLRAYDAIHLAAARYLSRRMTEPVVFATFDRVLWRAARDSGLDAWPPVSG